MAWSKVKTKFRKPIGWWYHKVMCEIAWVRRDSNNWDVYYKHLNVMCDKYGINLYGERFFPNNDLSSMPRHQKTERIEDC